MAAVRLVVNDAGALTAGDTAVRDRLQGLGHTVTIVGQGTAAAASDLVVLAPSVTSTGVSYAAVDAPIIGLAKQQWPNLGWSTNWGDAIGLNVTQINIRDDTHPVAAGFPVGAVTVASATMNTWRSPGGPPAAIHRVAAGTLSSPPDTDRILFVFPSGSTLLDGKTAQQRQVGWGIDSDAETTKLDANGWSIFDAAVAWTLDQSGPTFDPADLAAANVTDATADLSWTASSTTGVADYSVFTRTPQTGAAFDPTTDTPAASGITGTTHQLTGLAADTSYDTAVYGRIPPS